MRIDKYLAQNGFAESRQKAQNMIFSGNIQLCGRVIDKPSFEYTTDMGKIEICGDVMPYVSRGGLKLKAALDSFNISVTDKICADIGASTGGFTDCLLSEGAAFVYAVDSGHGQLHTKLACNQRVKSLEGLNAKELDMAALGINAGVDVVVMDLSFISQTKVYHAIDKILKSDGIFISLIKPQFEAGKEYVGKNGIVKDKAVHKFVANNIISAANCYGYICGGIIKSPITGGDGNTEYLAIFGKKLAPGYPNGIF